MARWDEGNAALRAAAYVSRGPDRGEVLLYAQLFHFSLFNSYDRCILPFARLR